MKSKPKILKREKIILTASQEKMIKSGWGNDVLENTEVEKITYLSDGLKIKGYIAYPKKTNNAKKYPCIIWNRGGYRNNGAIDQFTAKGMFGKIASWGYVVLASQYRGSIGSEGVDQIGGEDLNDILNLIPLAESLPFANTNIWGIEGWSRGGLMSFLTLKEKPVFKCAVLSGAVSDPASKIDGIPDKDNFYKKVWGGKNLNEEIKKRTAINFIDKLPKIPYLILHGAADEAVSVCQSLRLAEKFSEKNIPFRLVVFEDGDHFLKSYKKEVEELKKMWYAKYLK